MSCCTSYYDQNRENRLDGKTVAITGATDGIGLATAIECAQRGAHLIFLSRNQEKMISTKQLIEKIVNDVEIDMFRLDLADLNSVKSAADYLIKNGFKINILVLNAGLAYYSPELLYGINSVQVINHFSHFLLLHLLVDHLVGSEQEPARVVSLASEAHILANGSGKFWKTYESEKIAAEILGTGSDISGAYAESKLANILHMKSMAERHPLIKFVSVHPGVVDTSFADKWKSGIGNKCNLCLVRMLSFCWKPCVRSPAQGCQTSIYCICEREIIQGEYYADNKPKSIRIRGSKDLTVIKNELYELSIAFVKTSTHCK